MIKDTLAGCMLLQLMQDRNTMSLDKFQADILATKAHYERSGRNGSGMDAILLVHLLSKGLQEPNRELR